MAYTFPEMHTLIPEGEHGTAKVSHFEITPDTQSLRMSFRPQEYVAPGKYARLLVHGRIMMSDTHMERQSNWRFLRQAHGHVLIAGLGLGMIVFPLLERDEKEIASVTIIEKNPDVVKLVTPHLPEDKRLTVIEADIFEWKPRQKYNTIYFDIWPDITTDNLDDMAKLHRRFGRHLDRTDGKGWMDSWQRDFLLSHRRRNKARRGWW